jgi:hypothetical protein
METTRWLVRAVPGFGELSTRERTVIKDFALLWTCFEFKVLNTHGNANTIIKAMNQLQKHKKLRLVRFKSAIEHFRQRYYNERGFTPAFDELGFRNNDHRPVAEAFVANRTADEAAILSGLLIIILRLRNNVFHGVKWAYEIRGQFENFYYANNALIQVMELHR